MIEIVSSGKRHHLAEDDLTKMLCGASRVGKAAVVYEFEPGCEYGEQLGDCQKCAAVARRMGLIK